MLHCELLAKRPRRITARTMRVFADREIRDFRIINSADALGDRCIRETTTEVHAMNKDHTERRAFAALLQRLIYGPATICYPYGMQAMRRCYP